MTRSELSGWLVDAKRRPLVMGIVNLTPDSFSDGGQFSDPAAAVDHALRLVDAGADWLDLGAESTRPGAERVDAVEQLARLMPTLNRLRVSTPVLLSVDTTLSAVARAAIDAGADVVNDISAGRDDPQMLPLVARAGVATILMHMQGTPQTMQITPHYADVTTEVGRFLGERLAAAREAGIDPGSVLLDPGIGFGKTIRHNLQLLRELPRLAELGRPLVVGTSRKKFIATLTGDPSSERLFGTAATVAWSVTNEASVVRVHDVEAMAQVAKMAWAIANGID